MRCRPTNCARATGRRATSSSKPPKNRTSTNRGERRGHGGKAKQGNERDTSRGCGLGSRRQLQIVSCVALTSRVLGVLCGESGVCASAPLATEFQSALQVLLTSTKGLKDVDPDSER